MSKSISVSIEDRNFVAVDRTNCYVVFETYADNESGSGYMNNIGTFEAPTVPMVAGALEAAIKGAVRQMVKI